jgi:hypothetical protein
MASIPFEFACDKVAGFIMDPNEHQQYGYVTAFNGVGLAAAFPTDLTVSVPYNAGAAPANLVGYAPASDTVPTPICKVVGVIERLAWNGGVGDAIECDFWCSQENAVQIKTLQQSVLSTTKISAFQFWVAHFDQERKMWYEAAYILGPQKVLTGLITGGAQPNLDVNLNGEYVKEGIDVKVYCVKVKIAPAANQAYQLQFQNSAYKPLVKQWGLVVGTLAGQAVPPA